MLHDMLYLGKMIYVELASMPTFYFFVTFLRYNRTMVIVSWSDAYFFI